MAATHHHDLGRSRATDPLRSVVAAPVRDWTVQQWRKLLPWLQALRQASAITRYAVAALIVVAATAFRLALAKMLPGSPFILYFPCVFFAAYLFGWGAGVFATVLSAVLALYLFVPQSLTDIEVVVTLALFVAGGLVITALVEALHAATSRLRRALRDVTEAGHQKDLLLQELNHRVKNSLQLISSVVSLQSRNITDARSRTQFEAMARRIGAISRLHALLYLNQDFSVLEISGYLKAICADIVESLSDELRPVSLAVEADPLELPTEQAIRLALIVNELVTNACAHAAAGEGPLKVEVSLRVDRESALLTVADNGQGLPERWGAADSEGLGMKLVDGMARTTGAVLSYRSHDQGTTFSLEFPVAGRKHAGEARVAA